MKKARRDAAAVAAVALTVAAVPKGSAEITAPHLSGVFVA